jgi:hypothetical protein
MADLLEVLRAEHRKTKKHLRGLATAMRVLHTYNNGQPRKARKPLKMSAAARKRISMAQKRRWARVKAK